MTVRYAIVTAGRQGSTYLERSLNSHPNAYCAGEIFGTFTAWGESPIRSHLDDQVHSHPAKAVGFKLSMQDVMGNPELLGIIHEFGYRVIRLTRNHLDQYLSGRLATENAAWTPETKGKGVTSVEASPLELTAAFRWAMFTDRYLKSETQTLPGLDLSYEDLISPKAQPLICRFLDIEERPLDSGMTRQHPGSQREKLRNYDALKAHFAFTRWAHLFTD